jgi:hypothetical protein
MNNTQNLSEMLGNIQPSEINSEFIIRMYRERQKAENDFFLGIIKYFDEKSVQTPEIVMEDIPLNVDDVTQINGTGEEDESKKPKLNINEILATGDWKLIMSRKEENKESVNRYNMLENKNKTYKTPKTVVVQLYTKNKPTQTIIKFHSIGGCIYALLGLKGDPKDTILQKLGNKSFDGTFKIENQPNSMWKIIEIGDLPFDEYQKMCRANNNNRNNKKKKNDNNDSNVSNANENPASESKQVKKKKQWLFTYKEINKPETQRIYNQLSQFIDEFYPDSTPDEKTRIMNSLNNKRSYENWTAVRLDK